jgi:hypothetical protein
MLACVSMTIRKEARSLMHDSTSVATRRRVPRSRALLVAALVLSFFAATAAEAGATLEIQSYNDPAGDATVMTYRLLTSAGQPLGGGVADPFTLTEGEPKSFGPPSGTYIWKAVPPAGWQVSDIKCLNRFRPTNAGEFTPDLANGQVTVVHAGAEDQYCAFTNRRISAPGAGAPSTGVSPTLPGAHGAASKTTALLGVKPGLGFASATIRLARKSLIKAQLLNGKRVVGSVRVTHKAGTHVVKVLLSQRYRQSLKRQGRKRVTLTVRVVVVGSNHVTKVFRYGVIVRV